MTVIGVLGDSHGRIASVRKTLKIIGDVDMYIHTGDYVRDAKYIRLLTKKRVLYVGGNCDFGSGDREITETIEGRKIFITHGHNYRVKWDLFSLMMKAREETADIVVFGHIHMPYLSMEYGIHILNPGSISEPRGGSKAGAARMEIDGYNVNINMLNLSK